MLTIRIAAATIVAVAGLPGLLRAQAAPPQPPPPAEPVAPVVAPPAVSMVALYTDPRAVAAARVASTSAGGSFVTLDDGTMWEVYLPDRPAADAWAAGDFVRLEQISAPVQDYRARLVHGDAWSRDEAAARFIGRAETPRAEEP